MRPAGRFALAALVGASLFHLWRGADEVHVEPPAPARTNVAVQAPSTESAKPGSRSAAASAPAPPAPKKSLFTEALVATDLRVFVEAAKRDVEHGGAFYVNEALLECRLLRDTYLQPEKVAALKSRLAASSDAVSQRRLSSLEWQDKRCAGFTADELDMGSQKFLLGWAADKDPLITLRRQFGKVDRENVDERQKLISRVFETQDPSLIRIAGGVSMVDDGTGSGNLIGYVDGIRMGGLDAESYTYAWDLAACMTAAACSVQDSLLQSECAFAGHCFDSVQARVRDALGSEEKFNKAVGLSKRLQQIVASRDAGALRPHPKSN